METIKKNSEVRLEQEIRLGLSPSIELIPKQPMGETRLGLSPDMETIPNQPEKTNFFTP